MNLILVNVCLIVIQMNYIGCRIEVDKHGIYEFQFDHKMCGLTVKPDIEYTIDHPNRGAHHSALDHKGWPLDELWVKPKTEQMGVIQKEAPWVGLITMMINKTYLTCNGILLTPEWAFTTGECAYYLNHSSLPKHQILFRKGPDMDEWEGYDVIALPEVNHIGLLTDPRGIPDNYGLLHLVNRSAQTLTNEIYFTRNSICWPDFYSPFDGEKGENATYYAYDHNQQLIKANFWVRDCPKGTLNFIRNVWCSTPDNYFYEDPESTTLCNIPLGGVLVQYTNTQPFQAVLLGIGLRFDKFIAANGTQLCSYGHRTSYFLSAIGDRFAEDVGDFIKDYKNTTTTNNTTTSSP